jgi:hypothetical protein
MSSFTQFVRLIAVTALVGSAAAAPASGNIVLPRNQIDGPYSSLISCGCDGQTDAKIEDCQKVINAIDPNGVSATDPMKAVKVVNDDLLGQNIVMKIVGTCGYATGTYQNIMGPGGEGGELVGTTLDNKVVKAVLQKMLDECKDTDNDKVNGCASVSGGVLNIQHY